MSFMLCTFTVDGQWYAVPAEHVQEVMRSPAVTPVPLAPDYIAGLINLRGTVVCGVDVRARLGLSTGGEAMAVVVHRGNGVMALIVDTIEDVLPVDADSLEPPPSTIPRTARSLLLGVCPQDSGLIGVFDVDLLAKGQE